MLQKSTGMKKRKPLFSVFQSTNFIYLFFLLLEVSKSKDFVTESKVVKKTNQNNVPLKQKSCKPFYFGGGGSKNNGFKFLYHFLKWTDGFFSHEYVKKKDAGIFISMPTQNAVLDGPDNFLTLS